MNLQNEICRKVYDHHTALKGEIATSMLEVCSKSGISRDVIVSIVAILDAAVDSSSNKIVLDFQRTFNKNK